MPAPVVHVELRCLDVPELAEFYREVFGWGRDEGLSIENYSVLPVQGEQLTAAVGPVAEWGSPSAIFYIQVDDIDATLENIESRGGKAVMPRTEGPKFGATHILVFTRFVDPAGNVVGLVEKPTAG